MVILATTIEPSHSIVQPTLASSLLNPESFLLHQPVKFLLALFKFISMHVELLQHRIISISHCDVHPNAPVAVSISNHLGRYLLLTQSVTAFERLPSKFLNKAQNLLFVPFVSLQTVEEKSVVLLIVCDL